MNVPCVFPSCSLHIFLMWPNHLTLCLALVERAGSEVLCKPSATFSDIDHFLRRETCGERSYFGEHMSSLKIKQNGAKTMDMIMYEIVMQRPSPEECDQILKDANKSQGCHCVLNPTDDYQVRCGMEVLLYFWP